MILQVQNNLDSLTTTQSSYTSSNLSSGGTAIPVKNINAFEAQYAVQVGKTGEEQTEVVLLGTATPSGTSLFLSGTLRFDHPQDTPVYNIHFDKIVFKRSTSGTAGTATPLSGGTVSITPDSLYTELSDPSGASSYAYKTQFYNSVTFDISSESDWFIPGGPTFYSRQSLRNRVRDALYTSDYITQDDTINNWINEFLEEMNTAAVKVNKDYLMGTTSVAFGTSGLGTITAEDFMYARKIEVTYDGVNYGTSSMVPVNEFDDRTIYTGVYPRHSWMGDMVLQFLPKNASGTARIMYSKGEALLSNDSDELPHPMRRYTRGFIEYGLYRAYGKDQKTDQEMSHYNIAQKIKSDFINEISPRDNTGPHFIKTTDSLSASEDYFDENFYI